MNGYIHGLSGKGIVLPEGDAEEIRARVEALTLDMKPKSPAGALLIGQMATLSVRMERAAEHESAAIAKNVRHAASDFDEERIETANALYEALGQDPRNGLRKLRKSPEGVARMFDAWTDLRTDLTNDPTPIWGDEQLIEAAALTGLKERNAKGSRLGVLTRALHGDFGSLTDQDGGGLKDEARKNWAKTALIEQIDAELAELEAHYLTLDFETIDLDREEAGQRALFDTSKPAILARRYEADARRGFFKALKEFRQVEAEFEARNEATSALPTAPKPAGPSARMGSSREMAPPPDRDPSRPDTDTLSGQDWVVRGPDGESVRARQPLPPLV